MKAILLLSCILNGLSAHGYKSEINWRFSVKNSKPHWNADKINQYLERNLDNNHATYGTLRRDTRSLYYKKEKSFTLSNDQSESRHKGIPNKSRKEQRNVNGQLKNWEEFRKKFPQFFTVKGANSKALQKKIESLSKRSDTRDSNKFHRSDKQISMPHKNTWNHQDNSRSSSWFKTARSHPRAPTTKQQNIRSQRETILDPVAEEMKLAGFLESDSNVTMDNLKKRSVINNFGVSDTAYFVQYLLMFISVACLSSVLVVVFNQCCCRKYDDGNNVDTTNDQMVLLGKVCGTGDNRARTENHSNPSMAMNRSSGRFDPAEYIPEEFLPNDPAAEGDALGKRRKLEHWVGAKYIITPNNQQEEAGKNQSKERKSKKWYRRCFPAAVSEPFNVSDSNQAPNGDQECEIKSPHAQGKFQSTCGSNSQHRTPIYTKVDTLPDDVLRDGNVEQDIDEAIYPDYSDPSSSD